MANRFEMNGALKSRLLGVENAEQAADILKEAGQTVTPEDIAHLWDEISSYRKIKELSLDELEAVSGGLAYRRLRGHGGAEELVRFQRQLHMVGRDLRP